MKMTPEHFATLKAGCETTLKASPQMPEEYRKLGHSMQRLRWDVLRFSLIEHKSGIKWVCDTLYPYLNDDNINTALKAIIKDTP